MEAHTKKYLKGWLYVLAILSIYALIMRYTILTSSDPIDYYRFRKDVSDGCVRIITRDTTAFDSVLVYETVFLENTRTGVWYRLEHEFKHKTKFRAPVEEGYEYIIDEDGDIICRHDDGDVILGFLNDKNQKSALTRKNK